MNNQEVNGRRAARGRAIVHTNERYGNNTDDLGNVLLDLMHYARVDGRDFAKELAFAEKAYSEDTATEEFEATITPSQYGFDPFIHKFKAACLNDAIVYLNEFCVIHDAKFDLGGVKGPSKKT